MTQNQQTPIMQPLVAQNLSQGFSEYKLTEVLPKEYQSSLPSIKQIEDEFNDV